MLNFNKTMRLITGLSNGNSKSQDTMQLILESLNDILKNMGKQQKKTMKRIRKIYEMLEEAQKVDDISKEEQKEIQALENQLLDQIMNVSQVIKGYETGLILPDKNAMGDSLLSNGNQLRISGQKIEEMKKAFKLMDKNNDGFITKDELKILLQKIGEDSSDEAVNKIFKITDVSGDDKIEFDEFVRASIQNKI